MQEAKPEKEDSAKVSSGVAIPPHGRLLDALKIDQDSPRRVYVHRKEIGWLDESEGEQGGSSSEVEGREGEPGARASVTRRGGERASVGCW